MRNWTPKHTLQQASGSTIRPRTLHASPPVVLILGFLALIFLGTLLLYLPISQNGELGLFQAFFTATSAVTVTGLSIIDPGTQLTGFGQTILMLMIQLGGLGFSVISELRSKRAWNTLIPYSKVILIYTLVLNLAGTVIFWLLERGNPSSLGTLGGLDQGVNAFFYSVTSRTAGFATLDVSHFHDSTTLLIMALMFIGGASLSTAGGIKIGTFAVLVATVWSYLRGKPEVVLFRRSLSSDTIYKALALWLVTIFMVMAGAFLITVIEHERIPFINIIFEVVSAIATTGLSRNTTMELTTPSQAILTVLMFAGRLGPLTLVYSIATQKRSRIRYPGTEFQVG